MGDVQELIGEAYKRVEKSEWYKMGEDICVTARDELARLLEEKLVGTLGFLSLLDGPERFGDDACVEALTNKLLHEGVLQIDFSRTAEALLRDARKWNPDPSPPEIR